MNFVDIYQRYWKNGYVLTDMNLSGVDREMFRTLFNPVAEVFRKYQAGNVHLYTFGPGVPILGPELVVNGDFSNGAAWWNLVNPTAGSVAISSGGVRINSTDGSNGYFQHTAVNLVAGKSYIVQFDVTAWAAGTVGFTSDGGAVQLASAAGVGRYSTTIVAQGAAIVQFKRASGVTDITVDNISVREILGYSNTYSGFAAGNYFESTGVTHSSVDGSVGLVLDAAGSVGTDLVANGSFAVDSGWTKGAGVTISGGVCNIAAGAGYLEQAIPTAAGKTYWVTATNAGNAVYSGAWSSSGQSGALSGSPGGRGVGTNKFEFVATGSTSYIGFTATGAGALTIDNVIVREVTGIHASQSTPGYKPTLRRVSGVNYLEFDGVDDRLALGGPLFQMSDDHCVVAAIKLSGTPSGVYDVFTQRGATGTPIVCELNINSSRLPVATWRDDAGVLLQLAGPSALVVGQPYVIAARKVGNAQTLWVNGVIVASSNTVFGATTITTAGIGGDSQAAGGNYFKGAIYDVNPVKGTLTDTDVVTESKFAASLSGIQL